MEKGQSNLSETKGEQETNESLKLVPVAESVRYHKRAQKAEQKVEVLTEQLAEAKSEASKMAEQLSDVQLEQKLTQKLTAAGTVDVETALLVCKARLKGTQEPDLDACVEQLQKEKRYLFVNKDVSNNAVHKTAGAKERITNSQILERAAKKAATTGNRADLQEYLKLRRNFL